LLVQKSSVKVGNLPANIRLYQVLLIPNMTVGQEKSISWNYTTSRTGGNKPLQADTLYSANSRTCLHFLPYS